MTLGEITEIRGIKLLDSNVFSPAKSSFFRQIYNCKSQEIPCELILKWINSIRQGIEYLSRDDVFSISEVAKELNPFHLKINNMLNFYSQGTKFFKHYGSNPKKIRKNRRICKFKERRKHDTFEYKDDGKDAVHYLNLFGKETSKLIKLIKNKNITEKFSDEQRRNYRAFVNYFVYVAEKKCLKKDFSERNDEYIKSEDWDKCDFQTDEKLISAAFTLALTGDTTLISSDSDIERLMHFFYGGEGYKSKFSVLKPSHKISLYSDFGKGYECRFNSL